MSQTETYWNAFYAGRESSAVPCAASAFAGWVDERLPSDSEILEFGFGNARDSLWFARHGRTLRGYDFAESAVALARRRAAQEGVPIRFARLDLGNRRATIATAREIISGATTRTLAIYGRFLLHALDDPSRHNLLDLAASVLPGQGDLYVEFRTGLDAGTRHVFGEDHYRQYLNPEKVVTEIEARNGKVSHLETGHGLAVYKSEDPHVARLIAHWD